MKKEDLDPEVFKSLSEADQCAVNDGKNAVYLLQNYYEDSVFNSNLSFKHKEKCIDLIISEFPQNCDARDFAEWRHNVQINNGFEYDLRTHNSANYLLNNENIGLAVKLADFLAQKTIEIGDKGSARSIKQVIEGFIQYNWDQLKEKGFDVPVVIPEAFRRPEFFNLVYGQEEDINKIGAQALFQSTTMREWLVNSVRIDSEKKGMLTPFTQSEWDKIFKKYPWTEGKSYVLPSDCDESVQRTEYFQKMLKENPKGKVDGIFVDIDGTLIDKKGNFDSDFYKILEAFSKYEKVTIFTGGNVEKQTTRLKSAGVDTEKFPIVSKEDYRGYLFTGFIIDDISPEKQGFIMSDLKNRYLDINYFYNFNFDYEKLMEIKGKEELEDTLEELCLSCQASKTYDIASHTKLYDMRLEAIEKDPWRRADVGVLTAMKAHRLRSPSLSQRSRGVQSNRHAALETLRKYHEVHSKPKTTLRPMKPSERE